MNCHLLGRLFRSCNVSNFEYFPYWIVKKKVSVLLLLLLLLLLIGCRFLLRPYKFRIINVTVFTRVVHFKYWIYQSDQFVVCENFLFNLWLLMIVIVIFFTALFFNFPNARYVWKVLMNCVCSISMVWMRLDRHMRRIVTSTGRTYDDGYG